MKDYLLSHPWLYVLGLVIGMAIVWEIGRKTSEWLTRLRELDDRAAAAEEGSDLPLVLHRGGMIPPGTPAPRLKFPPYPRIPASIDGVFSDGGTIHTPLGRLPMQSRFVPDEASDIRRSLEMADQIVADQQALDVEPGPEVDVPAPGERGYRGPSQYIPVTVGAYTVHLLRQSPTTVSESIVSGDEGVPIEVPLEWEPVVVALAMEVVRLREGWSVSDTDWRPDDTGKGNHRTYE